MKTSKPIIKCLHLNEIPAGDLNYHYYHKSFEYYHTHDYWEFFVVTKGEYKHTISNKTQILSAGNAVFIHPSNEHILISLTESCEAINIMLTNDFLQETTNFFDDSFYKRLVDEKYALDLQISIAEQEKLYLLTSKLSYTTSNENTLALKKILTSSILEAIYSKLYLNENQYPPELETLILLLSTIPLNTKTPIETLAKLSNYSYSYMIKIFKLYTGMTINDYLIKRKIKTACDFLSMTNQGILEISSNLGYDSLSYFCHLFKRNVGVTPSQYRKQCKKNFNRIKKM